MAAVTEVDVEVLHVEWRVVCAQPELMITPSARRVDPVGIASAVDDFVTDDPPA
jgi:hypothetical protein